jgi:hypothetical protein
MGQLLALGIDTRVYVFNVGNEFRILYRLGTAVICNLPLFYRLIARQLVESHVTLLLL